jgi:putative ABC transport system substrate-binding protein
MTPTSLLRTTKTIVLLFHLVMVTSFFTAELSARERQSDSNQNVVKLGVLWPSPASHKALRPRLETALRGVGHAPGQNIVLEHRFPLKRDEIDKSAAELIDDKCDLYVAIGTPAAVSLQRRTSQTPIIFYDVADPVAAGLVKDLSKPGGNITGLSALAPELSAKLAELSKDALPGLSGLGVLWDRENPGNASQVEQFMAAARSLKLQVVPVGIRNDSDYYAAFDTMGKRGVGAVVVLRSSTNIENAKRIGSLAATRHLPTIGAFPQLVENGGVMAYYPSFDEMWTGLARYVSQVLGGIRPETLPVQQPARFELVINIRAATALGMNIPESLSLRAHRVIR